MGFVDAIKTCFSKYASFSGRATRSEYWWWVLFVVLGGVVTGIVNDGLNAVFGLAILVPSIAAALVGGTAITGGACNPLNVVFGALFVALIPVGSAAVGVDPQAQSIVYGAVLIVAVAATMSRSRNGIVK